MFRGFVSALEAAHPVVAAPEVAASWDQPSLLADLTVGALAAHLVSSAAGIDSFLDLPVPDGAEAIDVFSYYSPEPMPTALREALNARVADAARPGPAAVLTHFAEIRSRLGSRLMTESPDRLLRVPSRASPRAKVREADTYDSLTSLPSA